MMKIQNTPSGWFTWGFSLGALYLSLIDSCFGDLKVIDNLDIFISVTGMSLLCLYLLSNWIKENGE